MLGKKVIIAEAKKSLFFVWKLQRYSVLVTPKIVAVDFVFYRKTIFTAAYVTFSPFLQRNKDSIFP